MKRLHALLGAMAIMTMVGCTGKTNSPNPLGPSQPVVPGATTYYSENFNTNYISNWVASISGPCSGCIFAAMTTNTPFGSAGDYQLRIQTAPGSPGPSADSVIYYVIPYSSGAVTASFIVNSSLAANATYEVGFAVNGQIKEALTFNGTTFYCSALGGGTPFNLSYNTATWNTVSMAWDGGANTVYTVNGAATAPQNSLEPLTSSPPTTSAVFFVRMSTYTGGASSLYIDNVNLTN